MALSHIAERLLREADHADSDDAPAAVETPRPALQVGAAHDPAESAADRVADEVLRKLGAVGDGGGSAVAGPAAGLSGIPRIGAGGGAAPDAVTDAIDQARAGGRPLDTAVRRRMEPAFGHSLGAVRIHDDSRAAQVASTLSADAFTVGSDIFFGAGQYRPGSPDGDHVLAHELAHTTQSGPVRRRVIHRKLSGTAEAMENLGGERTSGKARKLFGKLTNWDRILAGLRQYEASEARVVSAPAQFGAVKPRMMKTLRGVMGSIASWRKDNSHAEMEAAVAAAHQQVVGGEKLIGADYRIKAGRRQAIALLEPRANTEMALLGDNDPGRWLGSLGLSPDKIVSHGRQDAGQKNQVQELEYSTEAGDFTGFFKKDVGFNPTPEGHEVDSGIRQYDPNYGARAVAMYRLDQLFNAGVTARAEFAVHRDDQGKSVLGTVLESAKGTAALNSTFGLDRQQADRLGPGSIALDDPVLQRGLNKLQILDAIAGQLDRHLGNYLIDTDDSGAVTGVTGIDLDMAFGSTMTSLDHRSAMSAHNYRGLPPAIDAEMGQAILRVDEKDIHAALTGLLTNSEVDATVKRFLAVKRAVKEASDAGQLRDNWGAGSAAEHGAAGEIQHPSRRTSYFEDVLHGSVIQLTDHIVEELHNALSGRSATHRIKSVLISTVHDLPPEVVEGLMDACAVTDTTGLARQLAIYFFDHQIPENQMTPIIDAVVTEMLESPAFDEAVVKCQEGGGLAHIMKTTLVSPITARVPAIARRATVAQRRQNRRARVGIGRGR